MANQQSYQISNAFAGDTAIDLTRVLNAKQVSERFGIHLTEVYRMAADGRLPSITIGSRRRFPEAWLQQFIRQLAQDQGLSLTEEGEVA